LWAVAVVAIGGAISLTPRHLPAKPASLCMTAFALTSLTAGETVPGDAVGYATSTVTCMDGSILNPCSVLAIMRFDFFDPVMGWIPVTTDTCQDGTVDCTNTDEIDFTDSIEDFPPGVYRFVISFYYGTCGHATSPIFPRYVQFTMR
jgi:hypothetical protein